MKRFGDYLKEVRKPIMTQRQLAESIGVGYPYISKLENNIEKSPSSEVLTKLAEVLNVDKDELYCYSRKTPPDIKKLIAEKPEIIKLLRLLKEKDATTYLLENLDELLYKCKYVDMNILENKDLIVLIIDPDTSKIVSANCAAQQFYRYSLDELNKLKINDINILPEDKVKDEMRKAKLEIRNHFNFKHKLRNDEVKEVKVISNPVIIKRKTYLYSIIQDTSILAYY